MATTVLEIDENELSGVLMASLVRRLKSRGWTREAAERVAEKAMKKVAKQVAPMRRSVLDEVGAAFDAGASDETLRVLVVSAWAVAGVEIADDLTRTSIAERN